jgi:replicative DNA helicase
VVCFVHRPEMYMDAETRQTSEDAGTAEIIVGKQRNGPIDDIRLAFVHRYARFENLAPVGFEGGPPPPEADGEEAPF